MRLDQLSKQVEEKLEQISTKSQSRVRTKKNLCIRVRNQREREGTRDSTSKGSRRVEGTYIQSPCSLPRVPADGSAPPDQVYATLAVAYWFFFFFHF